MAYNPGVVDRSGEILAQSRMAAGSSLLQGLTGGIETYRKNRLQNQLLTGENDALLAGLQQLQGMGGAAIDNLAPAGMSKLIEKHTKGGGLGLNESMQLNAMLNTTLKTAQAGQQMQAQQINQQIAAQQLQNEIVKGQQAQRDVGGLSAALKELAAIEAPTQSDVMSILSKQQLSPAAMGQFTEMVGRTSPKQKEAPAGYRYTTQGSLEMIPGGPAEESSRLARESAARQQRELDLRIQASEAQAKTEAEKKTAAEAAVKTAGEDAKLSAETTLREIAKAERLIESPLAQGFGSSIGGFFSGSAANDLETSYDVIRANEALGRIIALKKASPTGSTGFGALNLKELETLQSRFAKLSRSMSDKAAKESLEDLRSVIFRAFPDLREQSDSKLKQQSSAKPAANGGRFEVVEIKP